MTEQVHIPLDTSMTFRASIEEARRLARITRLCVIVHGRDGYSLGAFSPNVLDKERGPASTSAIWTRGWLRASVATSMRYCAEDRPKRHMRYCTRSRLRRIAEQRRSASFIRLP